MNWIAPSEKDPLTEPLEKRLWEAADQFRANSGLTSQQYSRPILGLIFLWFAEVRFAKQRAKLEKASAPSRRGCRVDEPAAYHAEGILYRAPEARFDFLLNLPEQADIGAKVNDAMRGIEKHKKNPSAELSIHGVETTDGTGRLCRLNLPVHGLEGDIYHGGQVNSYYDDPHDATGRFDFVLANPPFNVNAVDAAMRVSARRHPEGTPQDLPERQDHERLKDMVGTGRRSPFRSRSFNSSKEKSTKRGQNP